MIPFVFLKGSIQKQPPKPNPFRLKFDLNELEKTRYHPLNIPSFLRYKRLKLKRMNHHYHGLSALLNKKQEPSGFKICATPYHQKNSLQKAKLTHLFSTFFSF